MDSRQTLEELQEQFRSGSTNAMPLAGMIVWAALGVAAFFVAPPVLSNLALYVMAAILPLAFLIDKARGRNLFAGGDDPLTKLFLTSIIGIALSVPLVVIGVSGSDNHTLMTLGMAVLAGVIWITYGWAANDPVGLRHAIGRGIGCYLAYAFTPEPFRATAICAIVVLAYAYSLIFMLRTGQSFAESSSAKT
ncbi:MAG: hypothetical protein WA954_00040 [Parerythrobacter sp.]